MEDAKRWALEFLLRNSHLDTNLTITKQLLGKIKISNDDYRFNKTLLLTNLQHDFSTDSISESILPSLEILEEFLRSHGSPVTPAMSSAYCAVAVHCTINYLHLEPPNDHNEPYLDAVNRIWNCRVRLMSQGSLMFSPELERWRIDFDASLSDLQLRERMAFVDSRSDAIAKLRVFLNEQWLDLGPSFLELAANCHLSAKHQDREIQKCSAAAEKEHLSTTIEVQKVGECGHLELQTLVTDLDSSRVNGEILVENQSRDADEPCPDGINENMADVMEKDLTVLAYPTEIQKCSAAAEKEHLSTTIEVQKVGECGHLELQAPVTDLDSSRVNGEILVENQSRDADKPCPDGINENMADVMEKNQTSLSENRDHRTSLMEKNSTARTYEWDDLIDGSQDRTVDRNRLHLPSPRGRKLPPLKRYDNKSACITKRRPKKKWSQLEEETLKTAVDKLGRGNWKLILNSYKDKFDERTEVDLKDKWRNMTRYGGK